MTMKFNSPKKKYRASDICVLILFLAPMCATYMNVGIHEATQPFMTLFVFLGLITLFFIAGLFKEFVAYFKGFNKAQELLRIVKQDITVSGSIPQLILSALAFIIAFLNLFFIGSNKGACLIVADLGLLLCLSARISLSERIKRILAFSACLFMIPWYAYVNWYYGFNTIALLYLTFLFMGAVLLEYIKNDYDLIYLRYVQILLVLATFLFTLCYHARFGILTVLVFCLVWLILPWASEKRWASWALIFFFTFGSICFTGLYAMLGSSGFKIRILYKEVLSGRELIWKELWDAFLAQPFTGIGSSYSLKSLFIFEVHNGLFDILAVHGIVVFIIILFLLMIRLWAICKVKYRYYPDRRLAAAGVFALLFASFFENGFITPPYSMIFFALLLLTRD